MKAKTSKNFVVEVKRSKRVSVADRKRAFLARVAEVLRAQRMQAATRG